MSDLANNGKGLERNEPNRLKDGKDFRLFFNSEFAANADHQLGLLDGDRIADLLEPLVKAFLVPFDQSSAPPEMRPHLERTAERMILFGLRTHCVCFRCPNRFRHDDSSILEKLYDDWGVESIATSSSFRSYDKSNRGLPRLILNALFDREVEPIQKQLELGWWRRMKNRSKFQNLFAAGILLGVLYDVKSNELATQEARRHV